MNNYISLLETYFTHKFQRLGPTDELGRPKPYSEISTNTTVPSRCVRAEPLYPYYRAAVK